MNFLLGTATLFLTFVFSRPADEQLPPSREIFAKDFAEGWSLSVRSAPVGLESVLPFLPQSWRVKAKKAEVVSAVLLLRQDRRAPVTLWTRFLVEPDAFNLTGYDILDATFEERSICMLIAEKGTVWIHRTCPACPEICRAIVVPGGEWNPQEPALASFPKGRLFGKIGTAVGDEFPPIELFDAKYQRTTRLNYLLREGYKSISK